MPKDLFQSEKNVQALLSELEDGDCRQPYFQFALQNLCSGDVMRAIRDCCHPFKFGAQVSRSGRYITFDHPSLCFLRVPATTSTKVFVEDTDDKSRSRYFDLKFRAYGLFNLMSWLVEKAKVNGPKVIKSQRKSLRHARKVADKESPVRQRLLAQVLIRNAERVEEETFSRDGMDSTE